MNKSKLNLGANVRDIPRGINRRMYNPAGLGDSPATCIDQTVYSSLVIRQAGQRSNKTRRPVWWFMKAGSIIVGRFKRKGIFALQGVKTHTCIRFVLEGRLVLILIGLHM